MFKRFIEGASIVCLILALAMPASAIYDLNTDGVVRDESLVKVDYGLAIECVANAEAHYGPNTGSVPDTVDWDRHGVVLGPSSTPIKVTLSWHGEATMRWGYFQFKELTPSHTVGATPAYTWGTVGCVVVDSEPAMVQDFEVGMWDSVRVWADGTADGITFIAVTATIVK